MHFFGYIYSVCDIQCVQPKGHLQLNKLHSFIYAYTILELIFKTNKQKHLPDVYAATSEMQPNGISLYSIQMTIKLLNSDVGILDIF